MSENLWAPNRNRSRYHTEFVDLPPDRDITEGLLWEVIETLTKPEGEIVSSSGNALKPENIKYLGSYNWTEEMHPTIIVPGSPPVWRDRPLPFRVPRDRGVQYVDQSGFRMGTKPGLLSLFRAVDVVSQENTNSAIDWSTVDFITDRNGLRKLMRWLQYSQEAGDQSGAEPLKEFRIDLQLAGKKTVLMHRWEERYREVPEPSRRGYGLNFERESTQPAVGCERSTCHHRIIQYDFGGLKLVIRFEVDACLPQEADTTTPSTSHSKSSGSVSVDDLAASFQTLDVSKPPHPTQDAGEIDVIHAGTQLPQSHIVELVTRSMKRVENFDWQEQYPQLLLSYTPHLFLGVHDRGHFEWMIKHELGSTELRHVENSEKVQRSFRQLKEVLKKIQALVKEHGPRRNLSLMCREGALCVYERMSEEGIVEEEVLKRFDV